MPSDGYMDAAAVPVPDAGDDITLREQLAEGIKELLPVDPDDGTVVSEFGDFGPIWDTADEVSRGYADALLPLIREHVAAADSPQRLFGRLISTAKGREILDENGIHGVERATKAEAVIQRARAVLGDAHEVIDRGGIRREACIAADKVRAALDEEPPHG